MKPSNAAGKSAEERCRENLRSHNSIFGQGEMLYFRIDSQTIIRLFLIVVAFGDLAPVSI